MSAKFRSNYLRRRVYQRDHGICTACGCDTEQTHGVFWQALGHLQGLVGFRADSLWYDLVKLAGFTPQRASWWEADHTHPLSEGGADTLENLRTLCLPCHRQETKRLRKRLAKTESLKRKRPSPKYQQWQLNRLKE